MQFPRLAFPTIPVCCRMLSLMPLALFLICVAYMISVLKMINAACEAPLGYEDRDGFHYGMETRESAEM